MPVFRKRTPIPLPAETVFRWHERPGAIVRLAPPWQHVEVLEHDGIADGSRAILRIGRQPFGLRWEVEHAGYVAGKEFTDVQVEGPFAAWKHRHRVLPHDVDARISVLEDHVEYELPISSVLQLLAGPRAERELVRLFAYRHRVTEEDLLRHDRAGLEPMRIAITGSSGTVGRSLAAFLTGGGHTVLRLVRSRREQVRQGRSPHEQTAYWRPARGYADAGALEGVDAVIHLTGEPLFGSTWSRAHRARVLDSRVRSTRLLVEELSRLSRPPSTLLSASCYYVYGDHGSRVVNEAFQGDGSFLSDVFAAQEAAADRGLRIGMRVCHLRLGHVITGTKRLATQDRFVEGSHFVPWIGIDDVLYAALHLLASPELNGPFNLCSPHAALANELVDALGARARGAPSRLVKGFIGGGAGAAARASVRALPERLANSGFEFAYPTLDAAVSHLRGRFSVVPAAD